MTSISMWPRRARARDDAARRAAATRLSGVHVLFTAAGRPAQRSRRRRSCAARTASSTGATAAIAIFDDFLARLPCRQAQEAQARAAPRRGGRHRRSARCTAHEIDAALWHIVFAFSRAHLSRAWQRALPQRRILLERVARAMPGAVVVMLARTRRRARSPPRSSCAAPTRCTVATGARQRRFHSLHFERATTRASNTASAQGLAAFEPGTQGEHKLAARLRADTVTWSAHWIADRRFAVAIGDYLERERAAVARVRRLGGREHLPFRPDRLGSIPMP